MLTGFCGLVVPSFLETIWIRLGGPGCWVCVGLSSLTDSRHSDYLYTVCPVSAGLSSYRFRYSDYRKTVCPRMCLAILWQILIFTQCAQVCAGLSFRRRQCARVCVGLSYERFRHSDYRIAGKSALPGNINLSHFILWNCIMIKQSWSVQYQLATHKFWVIKMKHTRGKESTTTQMFFFISYLV